MPNSVQTFEFGTSSHGETVKGFRLGNARGTVAEFIEWGATWKGFFWRGGSRSLVLGCHDQSSYENQGAYLGAVVGRVANRLGFGRFTLEGKTYQLPCNLDSHHLHGGPMSFSRTLWHGEPLVDQRGPAVRFTHDSPTGEDGYPGDLSVVVDYVLDDLDALHVEFKAVAHQATIVNLTHHAYFNLSDAATIDAHEISVDSSEILETNADGMPTGSLISVEGTPLDLRQFQVIGKRLESTFPSLVRKGGFDHTYVFTDPGGHLTPVAVLRCHDTGIMLQVDTNQPSLQLYTGQYMADTPCGRGEVYPARAGVCLEPQGYPDAPNHSHFPNISVPSGGLYRSTIVYRFLPTR